MEGDSLLELNATGTAALRDGVLAYLDLDAITGTEFNRDPGDLSGLRESVRQNGLITPLACTPDGRLLAGRRRFAVLRELGWKRAPFIVIRPKTKAHALKVAIDENAERKNFTDPEYAGLIKQYHEQRQAEAFEITTGVALSAATVEKTTLDAIWSHEDTAGELGVPRRTISEALQVADLVEQHPELACKNAKQILRFAEAPAFTPKLYDIWSFNGRDPRYGQADYKWGLICGQIVENLLYYYTEPKDRVLDPMAGGGTTVDVCNSFDRTCEGFDIEPVRQDIRQHDITTGPPPMEQPPAQLAILEPPYFNMKQKDAYGSLDEYLDFLRMAVSNTAKCVVNGGYIALILMDQVTRCRATEHLPRSAIGEAYMMLRAAGLMYDRLVALPLTTEQYNEQQVIWGKKTKILLGINRQMWVFRRAETE